MGLITLNMPQSGQPNSTEDPKVASDLTTLQTLVNGSIDLSNLSAALQAIVPGTWTTYTPTWPGTIGNGSLSGYYQIYNKTCLYNIAMTCGTTTTCPVGAITFSVPFTSSGAAGPYIGHAHIYLNGNFTSGVGYVGNGTSTLTPYFPISSTNTYDSPMTQSNTAGVPNLIAGVGPIASGGSMQISGVYVTQ